MSMKTFAAVIFDMDGVLLDSETVCDLVWRKAAKECGIDGIEYLIEKNRGCNYADTRASLEHDLQSVSAADRFMNRTAELFNKIETEEGLPSMKGAREALEYLTKKGYRVALASSTEGDAVRRQMKNAGFIDFFETLTTGDTVARGKPDPEIYERACASLGLSPDVCCAIEDSPNGMRSAYRAGLSCIMVPDKIAPDDEMKKIAMCILPSLDAIGTVL